jgi:hypothetical protein
MMYHDSHEVLALRKMIENKKKFLLSVKNEFAYQQIQKEILFLENEILPIVLRNTNIIHSEFGKYAILAYDTALKYRCNGLLMYQPLEENYTDRPIIGIVNKRANLAFGTFGAMDIFIDNMDGMGAKVEPINLIINDLM